MPLLLLPVLVHVLVLILRLPPLPLLLLRVSVRFLGLVLRLPLLHLLKMAKRFMMALLVQVLPAYLPCCNLMESPLSAQTWTHHTFLWSSESSAQQLAAVLPRQITQTCTNMHNVRWGNLQCRSLPVAHCDNAVPDQNCSSVPYTCKADTSAN